MICWSAIGVAVLTLIGHDLYLGFCTDAPTYTMDVRRIASRWPIIPAMIGFLTGMLFTHFFWFR